MRRLLLSGASGLVLVMATSFALAQNPGGAPSSAPAPSGAARGGGDTAAPSGSGAAQQAPATGDTKSGTTSGDMPKAGTKSGNTAQERAAPMQDKGKAATDTKSEPAAKSATGAPASGAAKDAKNPSATPGTDSKSGAADSKSGGNNQSSAAAAPPPEKRTQITSAFKQEKVTEVTNVNFNISVGVAVPATVRIHPLPTRIVEIYPEWRGYDFILVRGKYIILRPKTREIVYIIEG